MIAQLVECPLLEWDVTGILFSDQALLIMEEQSSFFVQKVQIWPWQMFFLKKKKIFEHSNIYISYKTQTT